MILSNQSLLRTFSRVFFGSSNSTKEVPSTYIILERRQTSHTRTAQRVNQRCLGGKIVWTGRLIAFSLLEGFISHIFGTPISGVTELVQYIEHMCHVCACYRTNSLTVLLTYHHLWPNILQQNVCQNTLKVVGGRKKQAWQSSEWAVIDGTRSECMGCKAWLGYN